MLRDTISLILSIAILVSISVHAAAAPTNASIAAATYFLTKQDTLLYSVREDPKPSSTPDEISVNPLGEMHFRVSQGFDDILTLQVEGKNLTQVKQELKARLDANYYQNATVELQLKQQARKNGRVLFFGAVRANVLPLEPGIPRTVFEGVYQVGVTEFANLKKVKLHRLDAKTGKSRSWLIDLEAIKKGNRDQDVTLLDGDRIEVPEKRLVF